VPTKVSAIIINYNGSDVLEPCIDSLLGQTVSFDEITVVDNASTDDSCSFIPQKHPDIRLIQLGTNEGYAAAANLGIRNSDSELVAILNNDLMLDPDWLEKMLKHATDPWSFWASKIVFSSRPDRVDSAGDGMAVIGSGFKIGHGEPENLHHENREVFGPCGAAGLYRKDMLEELGGFSEEFFLIYEDADLNFRARLRGHRCILVSAAKVRHRVNLNIGTFSPTYVFYGHRNSEIVFWQNMPLKLLILYLPERLLFNLFSLFFFTYKGRGASFVSAKLAFLKIFPQIARRRRQIQSERVISTSELSRVLERNWLKYRIKKVPE
jgi:hypothetical protein